MKHVANRRSVGSRTLVALLAVVLVIGCVAGGTVAYLIDKSDTVTNTFTFGDINIKLEETTTEYKIVPGVDIAKDPFVTVIGGSEKCYLFVKVEEKNWPVDAAGNKKLTYEIAGSNDWQAVPGETNVYYQVVESQATNKVIPVLKGNVVHASTALTKADIETDQTKLPQLIFTAYAVQYDAIADVAAAWEQAQTAA